MSTRPEGHSPKDRTGHDNMKYAIRFDKSIGVLVIKTSGMMNGNDFTDMAEDILRNPERSQSNGVIFDHVDLDFSAVSVDDLEEIRAFHKRHDRQIGSGKSAIVVRQGFSDKWLKLWDKGTKIKTQNLVRVFEDFADAVCWLRG